MTDLCFPSEVCLLLSKVIESRFTSRVISPPLKILKTYSEGSLKLLKSICSLGGDLHDAAGCRILYTWYLVSPVPWVLVGMPRAFSVLPCVVCLALLVDLLLIGRQ